LNKKNAEKMQSHMQRYEAYVQICANFWICGIISTYAILKMPLYAEKYAICGFWQNMWSHITSIPLHNG